MQTIDKTEFVSMMKQRTKGFVIRTIQFANQQPQTYASNIIYKHLIRSSTSVGANYRSACKARSRKEFFSKICIVVEESDESMFWLELIKELKFYKDLRALNWLLNESLELTKIMSKAKGTMYY
jgi:four helix bundle protein